jgi:hypothetical protein
MTTSFLYIFLGLIGLTHILLILIPVVLVIIFYFLAKALANLSEGRNISRETAFWISFILGPIIGLIVIFASDKESIPSTNHKISKTCPDCAEDVNEAALKCKHCGHRWS